MRLWMGNIAPGTSDEEIKELVKKYAPELTCNKIERVEGTGSRPGAMLEITGGEMGALEKLSLRLNGIYWKERELVCQKLVH
ncbi:MAG TPA: RNA-binding protein [Casimicrobiaceae bacterium]